MKTAKDVSLIVNGEMLQTECTALFCRYCKNKVLCDMQFIADDMIMRGEY